jgi:hypothetical protein
MSSSNRAQPDSRTGVAAAPSGIMDTILGVLHCTMEGREGVYVSAPITTGRRFVEWRRGSGATLTPADEDYRVQHRIHVVLPNREHVRPLVRRLRQHFPGVVIDPTALEDIPSWVQDDYHSLWTEVVERYAHTVVFTDGWQYSSGCIREFLAAVRSGAALLREDLTWLNPHDGVRLIEEVVNSVDGSLLPTAPLSDALNEIRLLLDKNRPKAPDRTRTR